MKDASRPDRLDPHRRRPRRPARTRSSRPSGTVITFPGFLKAYEEGRDDPSEQDEERRLPQLQVGQAVEALDARGRRPRDEPSCALHRGEPREGARGQGHRPSVDVRVDHGHDPRSRVRLQEGHGARPDVPRVRGHEAARAALRTARRLRLHRPDGGRPRPHRRGRREPRRLAEPVLERCRRRARPPRARHRPARRDRGPGDQLDRDPAHRRRRARRPVRPVHRAGRDPRERARGHRARRAHGRARRGAALPAIRRARARERIRTRAARSSRRTAATAPT